MFLLVCAVLASAASAAGPARDTQAADKKIEMIVADVKSKMLIDPELAAAKGAELEKFVLSSTQLSHKRQALATARWLQGEAYLRLNDEARAAPLISAAWASISTDTAPSKLKGDILLSRGGIAAAKPDIAAALADYQSAFAVFRQVGEPRSQAIALLYIALLYRSAEDNRNALKYYGEALEFSSADPKLSVSILNNRANSLSQIGEFHRAAGDLVKALELAREMKSSVLEAQILRNLARSQLDAGRIADAERSIARGMALFGQGNNPTHAQFLSVAARAALMRGQLAVAAPLIRRAFAGVDLTKTTLSFRDSHETAFQIFRRLGQPVLALAHLEALKRLEDETAKLAASTNTALMAARFDYANQNLKIATLKQQELQRTVAFEQSRARLQRTIFAGVVLTTLIGVGGLIFGLVTIRRSRNEVRAANVVLGTTNAAMEKALAAKTEFLATTSHEIRTPLNGILGMTQVMLTDQSLSAPVRERLGVVHGAGVTMRALVDDILDVAKMETGNLTLESVPLDLQATLRDVAKLWEEQARARGVGFTLDLDECPAMIEGDPARLRQIVFNLLSNAMKFTSHGAVTVRAWASTDDRLTIAVRDTGIGIPLAKQEEIFESFKQVDAGTTRKFGGTGLGLAICRNLARAMGGDVFVSSEPGAGSTFSLTLPLVLAASGEGGSAASAACTGLLIVDRNPIVRSMFKTLLTPHAGDIWFAGSAEEALALIGDGDVCRVLIDQATLNLSEDPLAALTKIVDATHRAEVDLLAAKLDNGERTLLMACGISRIIDKPIGGAALVELLYPADDLGSTGSGSEPVASQAA